MAVDLTSLALIKPAAERIAVGHPRGPVVTTQELIKADDEAKQKARYKIELYLGKDRSSDPMKLCSGAVLIWESGRRLHGGGDEKMYWCGYPDCGKPFSSDNFGYMHAVCPICKRELFLDPEAKQRHIDVLKQENRPLNDIDKIPYVVGERFFKLPATKIADLLVTVFRDLQGDADVYLKFSRLDMRYDPKHETVHDLNNLEKARMMREPVIYTLKRIIQDTSTGADLRTRFLAMITA